MFPRLPSYNRTDRRGLDCWKPRIDLGPSTANIRESLSMTSPRRSRVANQLMLLAIAPNLFLLGQTAPAAAIQTRGGAEASQAADAKLPPTATAADQDLQPRSGSSHRKALLIGCNLYPALPEYRLQGPENDVRLLSRLLVSEKFGFPANNITTLVSSAARENQPTRANLVREFERLCENNRPGDEVLIFLAGHGCRITNLNPDDDPEPDGLDEAFVPMDVSCWDSGNPPAIGELIADDQFATWLSRLQSSGARVFFVADCCHSGSLDRGGKSAGEPLRVRHLPDVFPVSDKGSASPSTVRPEFPQGMVSLFAVPERDNAVEELMPPGNIQSAEGEKEFHGRLSYTLCRILNEASRPLTYRELLQQLKWSYSARNWYPYPYLEGEQIDHEILGYESWPERSVIHFQREKPYFRLNAGTLAQVTPGTIFAIYPPVGAPSDDQVLGHLRVVRSKLDSCEAIPCPFEQSPEISADQLPTVGRAEIAFRAYNDSRLPVVVIDISSDHAAAAQVESVQKIVANISSAPNALVKQTADADEAELLIRVSTDQITLTRKHELVAEPQGRTYRSFSSELDPARANLEKSLKVWLPAMSRAINLVKLGTAAEQGKSSAHALRSGKLQLEFFRAHLPNQTPNHGDYLPLDDLSQLQFREGDHLLIRVTNLGALPVRITGLVVESGFAINGLTPRVDGRSKDAAGRSYGNRVVPGEASYREFQIAIDESTTGIENFLLIAVPEENGGEEQDFRFLRQRPLQLETPQPQQTRSQSGSEFNQLINWRLFGQSLNRGSEKPPAALIIRVPWFVGPTGAESSQPQQM